MDENNLINLVGALLYIGLSIILLFVYRLIHDKWTPFDDHQQMANGNVAAAMSRGGAYVGVMLAAFGSIASSDRSYWRDLGSFGVDGLIAIAVFSVATLVLDKVVLPSVNNNKALEQNNQAVGIMEACAFVGLGAVMFGSFAGDDVNFWEGILSAIVFSALGLLTLVVVYRLYVYMWIAHKRCHVDNEIGNGNVAAALDAGSLVFGLGIVLAFSIGGSFTGWWNDLTSYAIAALGGVVAVAAGRGFSLCLLSNKLPNTGPQGHHGNVAKSLLVSAATVTVSTLTGLLTFL